MRTVSFSKSDQEDFYKLLRKRVNEYFKSNNISRFANANMVIKTIFMIALYITPFILILTIATNSFLAIVLWALMGIGMAGIGLSIMHDANHGAYSRKANVNKYVGWILLALGGSDVNWRIQHNILHHTYTNVTDLDEDIDAPSFLLRFSPHAKKYGIHKLQFLYAWFLYGLMTLIWFVTKDYQQTIRYNKMGLFKSQGVSLRKHWTVLILSKLIYGTILIGLPILIAPTAWYISILGFLLMQFIAGLILGLIFQPAHVVPTSEFPLPDPTNKIEVDWAVHQLHTTANFAPKSRIFSWYIGGLNYQIEHHLFPNICHVHYRNISKIVEKTAKEFKLPYYSNKTFAHALFEHGKMLYTLGRV